MRSISRPPRLFLTILFCLLPLPVRASGEVRALLFSSDGCDHCRAVWEEVIPPIQASFPLEIRRLEVSDPANHALMAAFQRARALPEGEVPLLVVGTKALQGEGEIRAGLLAEVLDLATRGGSDWPVPPAEALPALPILPGASDACGPGAPRSETCKPAVPAPDRR